jgi:hypothetical protein
MHPRMLAIAAGCSGGSCPAVYDTDPDLRPGELAVVGARAGQGLSSRLAGRVAQHEAAVTIDRAVLERALRPADVPAADGELFAQFSAFAYSAFRLECLQDYDGTGRDTEWIARLRAARRWGKSHQRVHVVTEPLTPAMQQELTEGYEGNVAAGEDIGIIPVAEGDWPAGVPRGDFWLFDSCRLYLMHYNDDGTWAGATRVTDPERVLGACQARDAARHRAVPWREYVASRPELRTRIAQ